MCNTLQRLRGPTLHFTAAGTSRSGRKSAAHGPGIWDSMCVHEHAAVGHRDELGLLEKWRALQRSLAASFAKLRCGLGEELTGTHLTSPRQRRGDQWACERRSSWWSLISQH